MLKRENQYFHLHAQKYGTMKKVRIIYAALVFLIMCFGILSRRSAFVPLCAGDILWALMIFFIVRTLFVNSGVRFITLVSLSVCYLVEISQLYQAEWINTIRQTLPGRLILGQGFLWADLFAYAIGVLIGILVECVFLKRFRTLFLF